MKSLYHIIHQNTLQNTLLFVLCWLLSPFMYAQKQDSKDWYLPHHQLSVLYGTAGRGQQSNHNIPSSNAVFGLAYTYNLTPYLYASLDYQFAYSNFDLMTTKKNFIGKLPSAENPIKVSIVKSADLEEDSYGQPKPEPNLFELTNNEGFIRRHNYNFSIGYMKVTARNILRLGVGYSYTNITGRFTESVISSAGALHTLYTGEQKAWVGNVILSYDFYLNQNLSLGVHFNGFMTNNPILSGCLALGYSPVLKTKNKKSPKV
jgi:hypothetical protein